MLHHLALEVFHEKERKDNSLHTSLNSVTYAKLRFPSKFLIRVIHRRHLIIFFILTIVKSSPIVNGGKTGFTDDDTIIYYFIPPQTG